MLRPNLLVIRVASLDVAEAFYRDALGLPLVRHRHGSGPEHCALEAPGFTFELYPLGPKDVPTTSVRLGFAVPRLPPVDAATLAAGDAPPAMSSDVDDGAETMRLLCERVAAAGGSVASLPRMSEWGLRAVCRDPDGHAIELVLPPPA